jgi:hypothetical protein
MMADADADANHILSCQEFNVQTYAATRRKRASHGIPCYCHHTHLYNLSLSLDGKNDDLSGIIILTWIFQTAGAPCTRQKVKTETNDGDRSLTPAILLFGSALHRLFHHT